MLTNVEGFEITRDNGVVSLTFTDMFGEGDVYRFPVIDARRIRDALTVLLEDDEP